MSKLLFALPFALLVGCAGGEESRADTILGLSGDATAGADVYDANCASCHGTDGSGGSGPSLLDEYPGAAEAVDVILEGTGDMPAFDTLADQDIADLLAFLDGL